MKWIHLAQDRGRLYAFVNTVMNLLEHNVKLCSMLVSCLAHFSTLKMEATCPPETSADFKRTTRPYIPEDRTLHNHSRKDLTSYRTMCLRVP
jgi:hypothetical protein